jgi:hypothetical protein
MTEDDKYSKVLGAVWCLGMLRDGKTIEKSTVEESISDLKEVMKTFEV